MFEHEPTVEEVPTKLDGQEMPQPKCAECGLSIPGHMVEWNRGCMKMTEGYGNIHWCKSCAADLGMWPKDDVDHELFRMRDEIVLVMDESAEDFKSNNYCLTVDGQQGYCYCAPFKEFINENH